MNIVMSVSSIFHIIKSPPVTHFVGNFFTFKKFEIYLGRGSTTPHPPTQFLVISPLIAMSVCIIFVVNPTWMTTGATAVTRPPDNVFIRYSIFHGVLPILDLVWFGAQYIFINLETEVDPQSIPPSP